MCATTHRYDSENNKCAHALMHVRLDLNKQERLTDAHINVSFIIFQ